MEERLPDGDILRSSISVTPWSQEVSGCRTGTKSQPGFCFGHDRRKVMTGHFSIQSDIRCFQSREIDATLKLFLGLLKGPDMFNGFRFCHFVGQPYRCVDCGHDPYHIVADGKVAV